MKFGINTIEDFDLRGKTVLCRVDINQPVDRNTGQLKSTARIRACIPTIKEISESGARLVLMAHQGSDIEYHNYYTTRPHAAVISELIDKDVNFIEDVCGPAAQEAVRTLQPGEILLLDNVRFMAEEQTLFERTLKLSHEEQAETLLVRKLAPLGDVYVCDAFAAAHRDQPSLCGFEQVMPSAMGRLFEKEYSVLSHLMEKPETPCVFVLGGAKVADAFMMMESVLKEGVADHILTGGLVCNIILASQAVDIGKASLNFIQKAGYGEYIEKAGILYEVYGDRIVLPVDFAYTRNGRRYEADLGNMPQEFPVTDIGEKTIKIYQDMILSAGTVFVNGPMGIFEEAETEDGTKGVWDALGDTNAYTVVGGGDSITATTKYDKTDDISYICTGGGALIRFLSGKELPVVKALRFAAKRKQEVET